MRQRREGQKIRHELDGGVSPFVGVFVILLLLPLLISILGVYIVPPAPEPIEVVQEGVVEKEVTE